MTSDNRSAWPTYWSDPGYNHKRWEFQQHFKGFPWKEVQEPADLRAERENRERRMRDWGDWRAAQSANDPAQSVKPAADREESLLTRTLARWDNMDEDDVDDEIHAIHEACHAVQAEHYGQAIREASIIPAPGSAAHVDHIQPKDASMLHRVATTLAGGIGEEIAFGHTFGSLDEKDCIAQVIKSGMSRNEALALIAEAADECRTVLAEEWDRVLEIAEALKEHRTLDAAWFGQENARRVRAHDKAKAAAQTRRVQLPLQTRSASVTSSGDTIKVCWGGGGRVLRNGWDGKFWEDLPPENADLGWLNSGRASFLHSHNQSSTSDVYGVVVGGSAFVRGGKGYCEIRLGANAPVGLKDGTLNNISIGYKINKMRQIPAGHDDVPVMVIDAYEIIEVSCVGTPADRDAQVLRKFEATVVG